MIIDYSENSRRIGYTEGESKLNHSQQHWVPKRSSRLPRECDFPMYETEFFRLCFILTKSLQKILF